MNFNEFKITFQNFPIILSQDAIRGLKSPQEMRNQLNRWQKKGLLISLKKGVYVLNKNERKVEIDRDLIANVLYEPSYISLEYALNFYGLIPERTADITSITTRKTMVLKNEFGNFIYQHIKPKAFRGFKKMGSKERSFFMAEPEKAVVDFLYLNLSQFGINTKKILKDSLRFQNLGQLRPSKLVQWGRLFQTKKLMKVIKELCSMVRDES